MAYRPAGCPECCDFIEATKCEGNTATYRVFVHATQLPAASGYFPHGCESTEPFPRRCWHIDNDGPRVKRAQNSVVVGFSALTELPASCSACLAEGDCNPEPVITPPDCGDCTAWLDALDRDDVRFYPLIPCVGPYTYSGPPVYVMASLYYLRHTSNIVRVYGYCFEVNPTHVGRGDLPSNAIAICCSGVVYTDFVDCHDCQYGRIFRTCPEWAAVAPAAITVLARTSVVSGYVFLSSGWASWGDTYAEWRAANPEIMAKFNALSVRTRNMSIWPLCAHTSNTFAELALHPSSMHITPTEGDCTECLYAALATPCNSTQALPLPVWINRAFAEALESRAHFRVGDRCYYLDPGTLIQAVNQPGFYTTPTALYPDCPSCGCGSPLDAEPLMGVRAYLCNGQNILSAPDLWFTADELPDQDEYVIVRWGRYCIFANPRDPVRPMPYGAIVVPLGSAQRYPSCGDCTSSGNNQPPTDPGNQPTDPPPKPVEPVPPKPPGIPPDGPGGGGPPATGDPTGPTGPGGPPSGPGGPGPGGPGYNPPPPPPDWPPLPPAFYRTLSACDGSGIYDGKHILASYTAGGGGGSNTVKMDDDKCYLLGEPFELPNPNTVNTANGAVVKNMQASSCTAYALTNCGDEEDVIYRIGEIWAGKVGKIVDIDGACRTVSEVQICDTEDAAPVDEVDYPTHETCEDCGCTNACPNGECFHARSSRIMVDYRIDGDPGNYQHWGGVIEINDLFEQCQWEGIVTRTTRYLGVTTTADVFVSVSMSCEANLPVWVMRDSVATTLIGGNSYGDSTCDGFEANQPHLHGGLAVIE